MAKTETIAEALARARRVLADTETPSLDARLLLQAAMGITHEAVIADPDQPLTHAEEFHSFITRRLADEPVSRILGKREFYGRNFKVTPAVLDPRADTEVVVELALSLMPAEAPVSFLDIGTGSGTIAVTLAAERPSWRGVALDISADALAVAKSNAETLNVTGHIDFALGNWFPPPSQFDLIISNPPYIPAEIIATLDDSVKNYDPHLALRGGADGLEAYRHISIHAAEFLKPHGVIVVEIGAGQAADVARIFALSGFILIRKTIDLGGHIRGLGFIQQ